MQILSARGRVCWDTIWRRVVNEGRRAQLRARPARLAGHAALYGTAGVLGKAAALVAVPYLTRQLGPDGYGLADLATSFAGLLVVLVRFAGDIPTMRLASAEPEKRKRLYSSFVFGTAVVSTATAVALLPASGLISHVLWSSPDAVSVAIASLLLVPVSAVQFALINVLRFVERPRAFAALAAVDLFAQLGLAVLLVALGFGPFGVIAGYVAGSAIGLAVGGIAARHYLSLDLDVSLGWRIFREGLPFVPGVAAFISADTISRMVAANFLSVGAVGHLALAIRLASVMALASMAFSMAWGPYGLSLQPSPTTRNVFGSVLLVLLALVGLVAVGLGALAPELSALLGGEGFVRASEAVPGLLLSSGLAAVLYVLTTAAGIARRGRSVAGSSLLGAGTQFAAIVVLLPVMGLPGFAIGAILGRLTSVLILGRAVSDTARLPLPGLGALALAVGAVLWVQALNADAAATLTIRATIAAAAAILAVTTLAFWVRQLNGRAVVPNRAGMS